MVKVETEWRIEMGKPYDSTYKFAPGEDRAGTMVCAGCGKDIDNKKHDWIYYKKTAAYDWSFVCFHRSCYKSDDGWQKIIDERDASIARDEMIKNSLKKVASNHGISDALVFAHYACEALGKDLKRGDQVVCDDGEIAIVKDCFRSRIFDGFVFSIETNRGTQFIDGDDVYEVRNSSRIDTPQEGD